jgi:hypothetical protein
MSSLVARMILLLPLPFVGIFLLGLIMRSCLFFEFIRSLWLQVGTQVPPVVDEKIRVWIYCFPEFASLSLCLLHIVCGGSFVKRVVYFRSRPHYVGGGERNQF